MAPKGAFCGTFSAMTNINPIRTKKALTQGKLREHIKNNEGRKDKLCLQVKVWNDLWLKKQSTGFVKSGIQILP